MKKSKKIEERISKEKQRNIEHYEKLGDDNKTLKDKIRDLEDRSRRDNLRFDGVREYENESWNEVLKDFLFENLETSKQNLHIETDKKKTILQEQLQQNSVAIKPKK